jgi:hypothetical protein
MTDAIDEVVRMEHAATGRDVLFFELGLVDVERGLIAALKQGETLDNGGNGDSSPQSQIRIAQGTLLALGTLCATLIGKGILDLQDAEDLVHRIKATAAIWRQHNCPFRALPSEMLAERLQQMIIAKRDIDQNIAASRNALRSGRAQ